MTVRVADPFGLVELHRGFHSTMPLVVTPRIVDLPAIPLGGAHAGSGDNRPRAFSTGSAEDVTVREYRRGDELRRVHWRSSARVGELMVRREEQDWQSRATVFLDNRSGAHAGQGLASSLETAVTVAASVAVHLTRLGFTVRLVTAAGDDSGARWHAREAEAATGPLLESLAMVQPVRATTIDTGWLGEQSYGGVTVAVLGRVSGPDARMLRQVHHHAGLALAIALDVDAWGQHRRPTGGATALLATQGWRVAGMTPSDRVDQVWRGLGAVRPAALRKMAGPGTPEVEVVPRTGPMDPGPLGPGPIEEVV
jgi:hypothetical protein